MFKHSQRTNPRRKPKFPRLKRLLSKRRDDTDRVEWYTTADADGNVQVHPNQTN